MSRYFSLVVLISDSNFDILVFPSKAILATQFDAFEKGTLAAFNQYGPITKNLRLHLALPLQSLLGVGVFNADGTSSFFFTFPYPFDCSR